MSYTHLTEAERYQVLALQQAGHCVGVSAIARELTRHRSSIHRELKRNMVFDPRIKSYSPSRAQSLCRYRRIVKALRRGNSPERWQEVYRCLCARLEPRADRRAPATRGWGAHQPRKHLSAHLGR